MASAALTFEALEHQLRHLARAAPRRGSSTERIALLLVVVGFSTTLMSMWLPQTRAAVWIALGGLGLEAIAGSIYLFLSLRESFVSLGNARWEYARNLDRDYPGYLHALAWLRGYPKDDIREMLGYVRMRQGSMLRRLGLLIGSAEHLGLLPIAVAIYLQLRSMTWPPSYSIWEALGAFVLVLFYAMSYFAMMMKLRLDSYVNLLEAAVEKAPS